MKNSLKAIALLLTLILCLGAIACTVPESPNETTLAPTPDTTPDESTPVATPEVSTPNESTPMATPAESSPETTPSVTTPPSTEPIPDPTLPIAKDELTSEQMAEVENALGAEIDWNKHYFGIYGEYIVFGTCDGSENYYTTDKSVTKVYYGYVNCVYTYKDGALTELANNKEINAKTKFEIGSVAIKKTAVKLPDISEDLTEDDLDLIKNSLNYLPKWYYGIYDGYAIFGEEGEVGEGYKLSFDSADSVGMKLKFVDWAYAYKDGEIFDLKDLTSGIELTDEDVTLINFIDCILYSDLIVND